MNLGAIKTYTADSMRQALVMVRQDLGPDALIVSQDTLGGKTVLHATLEDLSVDDTVAAASSGVVEVALPTDELLAEEQVELSHAAPADDIEPLNLARDLSRLRYPFDAITIDQLRGRFRFIGASGVGKTSLLIKLLVEWVMVNNPSDALVISTNDQQLAANEALQLTCQLLGVEMVSGQRLSGSNEAKTLVLIDTSASELQRAEPMQGVRDIVVISAMHSKKALESQLGAFAGDISGLLGLTHVDQPFDHAELTRWLLAAGIKPAFVGSSAYLPGGIQIADQQVLAEVLELTDA